ncbi:MAG: hypothetical protein ACYS8W_08840 [Planctomycetota bacterium]|jgi:predicted nucleic acid-binding Zn ribbon protein
MPIRVTCECGKNYSVKDGMAGKAFRCKICGEGIRIPDPRDDGKPEYESGPYLSQTKKVTEDEVRCPNCGRSMPKTLETCRHCGKNLRRNIRRTVFVAVASVVIMLLLLLVVVVFLLPSKGEVVGRKARELAQYIVQKNWTGVYELDSSRVTGVNYADYTSNLEKRFSDLKFKDVYVGEITVDADTDRVLTNLHVRARHTTAKNDFSKVFRVQWERRDGTWYAYINIAKVFMDLGDYVDSSRIVPEKECENCDGSGRAQCYTCTGGRLGDQSFCPKCYKSQGWTICPVCDGTGISSSDQP